MISTRTHRAASRLRSLISNVSAGHFLEHTDERATIGRAGQERTLREHTYPARMQELYGYLRARL